MAIVDTALNQAIAWIGEPNRAYDVTLSAAGSRIYTAGGLGFFAIDAGTRSVTGTVPEDPYDAYHSFRLLSIALNSSGERAYVTRLFDNTFDPGQLFVIDTSAYRIVDTLTTGHLPFGVAVGPDNPPFSPPPTDTPTATPAATATPTPSATIATPTVTPTPPPCVGDCDLNGTVSVDELVMGVNIALGDATLDQCPELEENGDGRVTVDELVLAVNAALNGCGHRLVGE